MDITSGLTALKTATDLIRSFLHVLNSREIEKSEIKDRIAEIQDCIATSKDALVDAKDEIQRLKDQIKASDDRKQIEKELEHDSRVYWRTHDNKRTGPYRPFCWEGIDKQLVHLTFAQEIQGGTLRRYECATHSQEFIIPSSRFTDVT